MEIKENYIGLNKTEVVHLKNYVSRRCPILKRPIRLYSCSFETEQNAVVVRLWTCIRKVLGSNLGLHTVYHN
jgi:hypothetical protein